MLPFDLMLPEFLKWAATGFTLLGAVMTASDLGRRVTGWGFVAFACGSACWLGAAQLEQETQLGLTNLVLLVVNAFGVWRWLVRKAPAGAGGGDAPGGAEARRPAGAPAG